MKLKLVDRINEYLDWNGKDKSYQGQVSDDLALDIYNIIQDLIDDSNDKDVTEKFVSENSLNQHFKRHCLGKHKGKKSRYVTVYYDFTTLGEYRNYEKLINVKCQNADAAVSSLESSVDLLTKLRELFKGNYTLEFTTRCGFHNSQSDVIVCLNAFATDVTTNYPDNTINFCILTPNFQTISLYAVDANYLETAFNRAVERFSNSTIRLAWNR